ncbi:MAG TPA: RNA ligase family protein [Thermoanaerobaculia bacterium]|nr:RNA ligase family protein [Thermoanaerobaculia bacterium]
MSVALESTTPAKSTHRVEVVRLPDLKPHPNADTLSLVHLFGGGFQCIVRTADWQPGQLAAFVPPDSVVPDSPTFAFLNGKNRIRVTRLRGLLSMGLLVPAPEGANEGDDVAEALGVLHYEPPVKWAGIGGGKGNGCADAIPGPSGIHLPKYDLESLRRYGAALAEGETVYVTGKIHGANGRWIFWEGEMYAGSRSFWRKEDPASPWWKALKANPEVELFCRQNPGLAVWGEVYGDVQEFRYGHKPGSLDIAVFDVYDAAKGEFASSEWLFGAADDHALPLVPLIYVGSFRPDAAFQEWPEGPSLIPDAGHVREGCVVKPAVERHDGRCGRVALKVVGAGYYERAKS